MPRNPGPSWGYRFLVRADALLPRFLFEAGVSIGTWLAVALMPEERRQSRTFLSLVNGRRATPVDVWRHFRAFAEILLLRLRVGRGDEHSCRLVPGSARDFESFLAEGRPALFGTFHFGRSDLLGFLLGDLGRPVAIVRQRVDNSEDTRILAERFGRTVSFLWMNEADQLLLGLKSALESGISLALQCDRLGFSGKTEAFEFLGARRRFPFTIYHLALIFEYPVAFCLGLPGDTAAETKVFAPPVFHPDFRAGRSVNLERAREHFQGVLAQLETLVRQHPTLWFNFLPLNPIVTPTPGADTACPSSRHTD